MDNIKNKAKYYRSLQKFRHSSTYYRNVKKIAKEMKEGQIMTDKNIIIQSTLVSYKNIVSNLPPPLITSISNVPLISINFSCVNLGMHVATTRVLDADEGELYNGRYAENSDEDVEDDDFSENYLKSNLKKWAIQNNIAHSSLKELLSLYSIYYNNNLFKTLPKDPRTLLSTPRTKPTFI